MRIDQLIMRCQRASHTFNIAYKDGANTSPRACTIHPHHWVSWSDRHLDIQTRSLEDTGRELMMSVQLEWFLYWPHNKNMNIILVSRFGLMQDTDLTKQNSHTLNKAKIVKMVLFNFKQIWYTVNKTAIKILSSNFVEDNDETKIENILLLYSTDVVHLHCIALKD